MAFALVGNFLISHLLFLDGLHIPDKRGAQATASFIAHNSHPEDPVVVSSSLLYLPMLYHLDGRTNCRLYSDGQPLVLAPGTAVLTPHDLITDSQLREISARSVWVVEVGFRGSVYDPVSVPLHWTQKSRQLFHEVFPDRTEVVVVQYEVPP